MVIAFISSRPRPRSPGQREVLDPVANSIMGLWDVVNNLTRLRSTQRERYRVTIFGSTRVPEDHRVYAAVRNVAEELTRMDATPSLALGRGVPGGIGTVLETMMIWQLIQVGHLQNTRSFWLKNVRGTRSLVSAPHAPAGTPPGPPRGYSSPDMRGGWTRDLADPARTPRRLGCRQEEEDIWFTSSLTPPAGVLDPVLSSLIGQNSDRR